MCFSKLMGLCYWALRTLLSTIHIYVVSRKPTIRKRHYGIESDASDGDLYRADGSINIWNPTTLINFEDDGYALIAWIQKHTRYFHGLEFNTNSRNLLASGAKNGELCKYNLANPIAPTHFPPLKGVGSCDQGEVSFLYWNQKVQHLLVSTSYSGTRVIWDLRRQKTIISFTDVTQRRCSILQWNPDASIELIVHK